MQLNTSLSHRMELRTVIAPRMIQSMEILQLPIMALQERIEHELQENPVLELKEAGLDGEQQGTAETEEPTVEVPEEKPEAEAVGTEKELVIDDTGDN